ncbi:hypothetical protein HPB51_012034 [Rhipicephalus microplus]|uniref:Uncharacterized protein n=1 Tax=Rhipicephalus microplus TaxID=6941 RepID=A0A9J6F2H6_RHIMP|nr:hypothetical protein HPB51_012034 [Rhipicephalus microplus]
MASQRTSQLRDHFSAARRSPSKLKQRKHTAAPEHSESRWNRFLMIVLSSCLVSSVTALGLLLAPLIARRYFYLKRAQPDADAGTADVWEAPVLDKPRFEQRYYQQSRSNATPRRAASGHRSFLAEVVPRPKNPIFCVLEAKTVAKEGVGSALYRFCSHIVVCCGAVDQSWLDVEGDSLSAAVSRLRSRYPDVQRVLGIGGPSANVTTMTRAMENSSKRARLVNNIVSTLISLGFDWGSLVHVPRPEQLQGRPETLGYFVEALCRLAARASLRTAVILPAEPDIEAVVYESVRPLRGSHYLTLIKMTEAADARPFSASHSPCSIFSKFNHGAGPEKAGKDDAIMSQGSKLFAGLSAAAFEFDAVREGSAATEVLRFRRIASRTELCRGDKGWKVRRSDGCVVASSGSLSWVAMDPQSDWGFLSKVRGVVVFDIEFDDILGKCGPPYSFMRSVYLVLESNAGR